MICEKTCPVEAINIARKRVIDPYKCMFCAICVRVCLEHAFYLAHRPNAFYQRNQLLSS